MVIDQNGILVHKGSIGARNDISNVVEVIEESLMVASLSAGKDLSSAERVRVFPHPASSEVHFESEMFIQGITLYDLAGKKVLEQVYGPGKGARIRLDLSELDQGIYLYMVQGEKGPQSGKLLIQE
jgi:hypothetical protein